MGDGERVTEIVWHGPRGDALGREYLAFGVGARVTFRSGAAVPSGLFCQSWSLGCRSAVSGSYSPAHAGHDRPDVDRCRRVLVTDAVRAGRLAAGYFLVFLGPGSARLANRGRLS